MVTYGALSMREKAAGGPWTEPGGCCYQEQGGLAGWPPGTDASTQREPDKASKRRKAKQAYPRRCKQLGGAEYCRAGLSL